MYNFGIINDLQLKTFCSETPRECPKKLTLLIKNEWAWNCKLIYNVYRKKILYNIKLLITLRFLATGD